MTMQTKAMPVSKAGENATAPTTATTTTTTTAITLAAALAAMILPMALNACSPAPNMGKANAGMDITTDDVGTIAVAGIAELSLPEWLASVQRRQRRAAAALPESTSAAPARAIALPDKARLQAASDYAGGNPFMPKTGIEDDGPNAESPLAAANAGAAVTPTLYLPPLRMLGTVTDHGITCALIRADKRVSCVAQGADVPAWPLTVAAITRRTVALDYAAPDVREGLALSRLILRQGTAQAEQQPGGAADSSKDAPRDTSPARATGNRMALDAQDIDIAALLQIFARFCGTNIIAGDKVKGSVSIDLHDLSWPQALQAVLQSKGLASRQNGNVIWVASEQDMAQRQKAELQRHVAQVALATSKSVLEGELFQLNYQKADSVRKLLHIGEDGRSKPGGNSTLLSARGSAIVDTRSNQLLITDTPAALQRVRALIEKIDVASRQVMIQAYIVEANHQFSRNLGARLGFAGGRSGGSAREARDGDSDSTVSNIGGNMAGNRGEGKDAGTGTADGGGHYHNAAFDLPARAIAGLGAGQIALSLFNPTAAHFLTLELSALEADGKGRVVSSPRVVTADQQAALIEQGEEMPYQESAGDGATATAFKKANLKLEVTPQITPDNQIILRVDIHKDSRGRVTQGGLAINTKHIKTQVQVENDGTVVIGGIYTETTDDTVTKVPVLGDLPLLGVLFRSTAKLHDKTELLIFLTPRIVGTDNPAR